MRLRPLGRTFFYDAGDLRLDQGDQVLVEDKRAGAVLGVVSLPSGLRPARPLAGRVIRRASLADQQRAHEEERSQREALAFAQERAAAHQLPIKFFRIEISPGEAKSTFTFSSEHRVDFRELVRDLAARFRRRIDLRQVGVRDEAKMVGGIGSCGRELCCSTFLPKFEPVTIRMAKNQNLALNPARVSGQCGRLKCCLVYEEAQYVQARKNLPKLGKTVETPDGFGRVDDLDILGGRVRVSFAEKPPQTYPAESLRWARAAPGPTGETP